MPSLRRNLLLGAAAAITVVFAVLAGVLYVAVRGWLIAEFDRGLLAEAESLRAATEFHGDSVRIDFDGEQPAQFTGGGGPHAQYFELWQAGQPVAKSPSLGGRDLAFQPALPGQPSFRFATVPGGAAGVRQVSIAYDVRRESHEGEAPSPPTPLPPAEPRAKQGSLTLLVAGDASALASALAQLRWLLGAACGAALLGALALLAWTTRRGLAPVDRIADRIGRVGRASLSDRLDATSVPLELRPIVERLNDMLARLESAFARERAFTADVAHELRTPLAGLETSLEVCASRPRPPQEYQRVVGRCLDVTRQMHAMVDSLLTLARADAGTLAVSSVVCDLGALVDEAWRPLAGRAAERRLRVTRTIGVNAPVRTDREKLRQVLHNLFDNAVCYADEGGTVDVRAAQQPGAVYINVANSGSRLSQEQANQAGERFWRGDAARSDTGNHCGLGLAITRELVGVLGGRIEVTSSVGGEFCVRVTLPASPGERGTSPVAASAAVDRVAAHAPAGSD